MSSRLFVHLLGHLGILLLEAVAEALLGSHPLLDAAAEAARLAGGDGLGGEVVDAGVEAGFDKTAEGVHELLNLTLLDALLQGALLGGCEGIHCDVVRAVEKCD